MRRRVLVTGARGFVARNLIAHLAHDPSMDVLTWAREDGLESLGRRISETDAVVHLAGVNRPKQLGELLEGNEMLTEYIVSRVRAVQLSPLLIYSSSSQAGNGTPYGSSKAAAEEIVSSLANDRGASAVVLRLPNVFGKWGRPEYNSFISTFCHRLANGQAIEVHDPSAVVSLVHVDDVCTAIRDLILRPRAVGVSVEQVSPVFHTTVGYVASILMDIAGGRRAGSIPNLGDALTWKLLSTLTSYFPPDTLCATLDERADARGELAELLRGPGLGQVFVSRTRPGARRGGHWHHAKVEKFFVLAGRAVVRFRRIDGSEVFSYPVEGGKWQVVDIPPGWTHDIVNTGEEDLLTLFWANEAFDPSRPDTFALPVERGSS